MTTTNRLVRTQEAANILGVARSTLWSLSKRPDFPKQVVLSRYIRGWMLHDLIGWLEKQQEGAGHGQDR